MTPIFSPHPKRLKRPIFSDSDTGLGGPLDTLSLY
jgi:hypothetical protein